MKFSLDLGHSLKKLRETTIFLLYGAEFRQCFMFKVHLKVLYICTVVIVLQHHLQPE